MKATLIALALCLAAGAPARAQEDPNDLIITIIRLSPVEPALYAYRAMPVKADAAKRKEILKKNAETAEENAKKAKEFIKETEEYIKIAETQDDEGYKEEIPVAQAKLEKWREILKRETATAAKMRAALVKIHLKPHKKALKAGLKSIGKIIKID